MYFCKEFFMEKKIVEVVCTKDMLKCYHTIIVS